MTKSAGSKTAQDYIDVAIEHITPSPFNKRTVKQSEVDSLRESIKVQGVLQPILVRPATGKQKVLIAYEIVAGEQRWRAARAAGLKTIPTIVKVDDRRRGAGSADIHPLDEAAQFAQLQQLKKQPAAEVARTVGKDEKYVSRRLLLLALIPDAERDFRDDLITLGHALEISRLDPNVQVYALAACYGRHYKGQKNGQDVYEPIKSELKSVAQLQEWITSNIMLDLHSAPFKMTDTRLRSDGLICVECPQRTGFNKLLFEDVKKGDTCTNPLCFQGKVQALINITRTELSGDEKNPSPLVAIYYEHNMPAGTIPYDKYRRIENKKDRCEFAEGAVIYAPRHKQHGQTLTICREPKCKDHLGRYADNRSSSSHSRQNKAGAGSPEFNKRKQELFDIKVADLVRRRVFAQALPGFKSPLPRLWLQLVAAEFYVRVPSYDQGTVRECLIACELLKDERSLPGYSSGGKQIHEYLDTLSDRQLAQFMALCAFAHHGENQYLKTPKNQAGCDVR